jgi:subtilisin family serine protease
MRKAITALTLFCLFIILVSQRPAVDPDKKYVDGEVIVRFRPGLAVSHAQMVSGLASDFNLVGLKMIEMLSGRLNIFLFSFNSGIMTDASFLAEIKRHPLVSQAQFNHFIKLRDYIPNDPSFGQQWNMRNTGQGGGTPGADISAPQAWDSATGGVTQLGDTIIISIVDDGFDLSHQDLAFWKNHHEIPDNGIDDDSNGYVDDYDGWSSWTHTGHITSADHGTHVTGIAAAIGNNTRGVCGVNWKTKVMPVEGSATVESIVVEAYAYVYEMRKLYNETNGEKGAFIVATNSSFGVDYGQPEDYPIWGAMYDSMGMEGILSAAATANGNWNVDSLGDIPTAFPSEYLISVTNTTNKDEKYPYAAWGHTTIDLGAPGTNIYSTRQGNTYGSKSGCSMSSPHVAGAVALLYSAADPAFLEAYHNDPAGMALVIKQYILDGTDPIASLQGITVTGGRLNLFNSIQLLRNHQVTFSPMSIYRILPPDSLDLTSFTMLNNTQQTMPFNITYPDTVSWISAEPLLGNLIPGETNTINVTINTEGMTTGLHYAGLTIKYGGSRQYVLPVDVKVDPFAGIRDNKLSDPPAVLTMYPNPFAGNVGLRLDVLQRSDISLTVYNQGGQSVRQLLNMQIPQGHTELIWDGMDDGGSPVSPGIYLIRLASGKYTVTKKIVKVK